MQKQNSAEIIESFSKTICTRELNEVQDNVILKQVQVLLVAASGCEFDAVRRYLKPIFGNSLLQHTQNNLHFIIGKYGECDTELGNHDAAENVPKSAIKVFPNIDAIISVGTITGIGSAKEFDIVISTNISVYELSTGLGEPETHICKRIRVDTSELLCNFFRPNQWPSDGNLLIENLNGIKPCIRLGTILSGPHVNDCLTLKSELLSFYPMAVGIDSRCADLFARNRNNTHIMIVKCVTKERANQSIAALLAADCVEYYFNSKSPQLSYILADSRGECKIF